jgi:hypothetical protein
MTSDRSTEAVLGRRLTKKAYVPGPVPQLAAGRVPKVSIIIPCYNYGRFLPDSVGRSLAQEGVEPEVIVVDDASTDDSADIAERYAKEDPRVIVLRQQENTGHVAAWNNGYKLATGEFIVRVDADDMLTPGSLARSVALFDAYPSVGLVYGYPRHFTTELPPAPELGPPHGWSIWSGADWVAERCRRGYNCITTPEAVIRASVMREIGPLSPRLGFAQDMEMWVRTAAVSDVGRIDGPDQALHRDHPASMSVTVGAGRILDITERRTVFEVLFDGPGGRLPNATALHNTAKRALAAEALEEACRAYDRRRTQTMDVDGFVEFALATYPDVRDLPEWRALQRRRRVGAKWAPLAPSAVAGIVRRRYQHETRYRRWTKVGV